jgi:hypothetical protein
LSTTICVDNENEKEILNKYEMKVLNENQSEQKQNFKKHGEKLMMV